MNKEHTWGEVRNARDVLHNEITAIEREENKQKKPLVEKFCG